MVPGLRRRLLEVLAGTGAAAQAGRGEAGAGIAQLDLGKGHERYKESFKTADVAIAEGWVERPSAGAALRRAQRAPPRLARDLVVRHPSLRRAARGTRDHLGRLRTTLQKEPPWRSG